MKEKQALEVMNNQPLNRAEIRKIMHRKCPCGSGKLYKNCCLENDIKKHVEIEARLMKKRKKGTYDSRGRLRGTIKVTKGG